MDDNNIIQSIILFSDATRTTGYRECFHGSACHRYSDERRRRHAVSPVAAGPRALAYEICTGLLTPGRRYILVYIQSSRIRLYTVGTDAVVETGEEETTIRPGIAERIQ